MFVVISNSPVGNQKAPIRGVDCYPLTTEISDAGVKPVMDYGKIRYMPFRPDLHRALVLGTDPGAKDKSKSTPDEFKSL